MRGIYVHLPFCPYVCPYCDFAKWPHRKSAADRYLEALYAEIDATSPLSASTIFFGGGTPNAYDATVIAALVIRLREKFTVDGEISIEVNPELVKEGDFAAYVEAGINRLSIGVQSFETSEIATLGRKHDAKQVQEVVRLARRAGIASISLDLMFAIPGQTHQTWRASLERAIALEVDHVSTYGLTVEENTPYAAWQAKEPDAFFDDEREAELYGIAIEMLERAGYQHYEISNFAQSGHICLHNMNYWENGEYIGLGVGAASYLDGVRSTHTRSLDAYVAGDSSGENERLEGEQRIGEATMLALRTAQGVRVKAFNERYQMDFLQHYARIIKDLEISGILECSPEYVRLTRRGRFVANNACAAFITST